MQLSRYRPAVYWLWAFALLSPLQDAAAQPEKPKLESQRPLGEAAAPQPRDGKTPGAKPAPLGKPSVPPHQDLAALPPPVLETVKAMADAARSGQIEAMQRVLEMNELPPIVSRGEKAGAIEYWRRISLDRSGRDVLAAMLDIIAAGYEIRKTGGQDMYVWPYFAEQKWSELSPPQMVDAYRVLTREEAEAMKSSGVYPGWRLGIGADGTWHYFVKGQ